MFRQLIAIAAALVPLAAGAERKPFQAQSSSTIAYRVTNGEETVEITNVAYEVSGGHVAGRPADERLVLRKTTRSRQVFGEKGVKAAVTFEAWPLGADLGQRPVYAITAEGVDGRIAGNALLVLRAARRRWTGGRSTDSATAGTCSIPTSRCWSSPSRARS